MQQAKECNPNIQLYGLAWAFSGWVADSKAQLTNKTATYIVKWLLAAMV